MCKFVLIQEGIGRRPWDLSMLVSIQTRFPMTGCKTERMKEAESENRREEPHLGGRRMPLVPKPCSLFLRARWSRRAPIWYPRSAISYKYNRDQFIQEGSLPERGRRLADTTTQPSAEAHGSTARVELSLAWRDYSICVIRACAPANIAPCSLCSL